MKNLKKWTAEEYNNALDAFYNPDYESGPDYKDLAAERYSALSEYAYQNFISMKGVPDALNCPRSFMAWEDSLFDEEVGR